MAQKMVYCGEWIDRQPFTEAVYEIITDEDYRPLPGRGMTGAEILNAALKEKGSDERLTFGLTKTEIQRQKRMGLL